jgi:REP element-mobilizing transposase RayT
MPHLTRAPFAAAHPCHVTVKVREGIAPLRRRDVVREVEASFRKACERGTFRLLHYSIQRDHLHAIVEANGAAALGSGMKSLAARFARAVNRALQRSGPVVRDRYHVRVLKTPTQVRNALRYVLLNARRHAAKLGGGRKLPGPVRLDEASSARWFDGWAWVPREEVETRTVLPAAVGRPRSWLLRVGWRLRGLIDPSDVPGTA